MLRVPRRVVQLGWIPLVLAVSPANLRAQSCVDGLPPLGSVTLLAGDCDPGIYPTTTCVRARVECQGLAPIVVEMRITEPPVVDGTVVMGSGAGGTSFVSDESGGPALVEAMVWNGFRVIDFRWESHWFLHGTSVRRQSCRYATLIAFLAAQYPDEEFCVTGNSGAAGEIGYALSTWGLENDIDVAVLTGGPPMTRLDYLCLAPPFWQELCPGLVPPGTLEAECPGVTPCSASPNPICTICPVTSAAALRADSILYVGADTTHPNTRIHFVFGREDCSLLRPMGPLYASVVTGDGPVQVEYVSGTPHAVYATQAGRTAILAALLGSG